MSDERIKALPPESYDELQLEARKNFEKLRGTTLFGPFESLIHSPEVLTHAQSLGEYLRYRSSLGEQLSEMVILITARVWNQQYEWSLHQPLAIKAGLSEKLTDAIANSERPAEMNEKEAVCYDFSVELHTTRQISDETYGRAIALFGERGVIDLTAINGYYAFLAMQLNVIRTPPVDGGPSLSEENQK